jgi:hypothetical protein
MCGYEASFLRDLFYAIFLCAREDAGIVKDQDLAEVAQPEWIRNEYNRAITSAGPGPGNRHHAAVEAGTNC